MESPTGSSAIIMEIGCLLICFLKGVPEPPLSYPRSWRVQEGALPSSWRSAARRFFFTRCDRSPAFLPKIMESPTGSSAIIMDIGCYSILLFPYPWRVQEGPLPSSWNFAEEPNWFNHIFVRMCVIFVYLRVRVVLCPMGPLSETAWLHILYQYILFDHYLHAFNFLCVNARWSYEMPW